MVDPRKRSLAERAGFEPAVNHQVSSKTDAFNHNGPQIGTHESGAYRHSEARPVTETLPADLQEVIDAWPKLDDSLRTAVLAVVRSQ